MRIKLLRCVAVVIFLAGVSVVRAAIPPAENLLPSDTLAFFTIPDCNAFRAASKVSPQMMFWNDPAMKPFHDKLVGKFTEKYLAPLEQDLGMKVADFADLPQGQFTFAFTVNGSNGHDDIPPGLLLLLDTKASSDSLKTNLTALVKKWTDNGRTIRTENIHGLPFTVVTLSSNDLDGLFGAQTPVSEIGKEPKPRKPVDIYFTQFQSLLIAGNSPKVVEPVAAHLTGGGAPSIADDATFAADKLAQFRDAPTYYAWFNGKLFFNLISQAPDDADVAGSASLMPNFSAAKIIGALGLGNLKSASLVLNESRDGSAMNLHLNVPDDGRNGLLKIFSLSAKDANPPAFVPAGTVKFTRVRLDGKQAWDELQKMVAAISPQGLAGLNSVISMANATAQQKDPSFDIRNNLFGNLGDDIISYQLPPVGAALAALASPPSLTLVATANPDQMIQAIKVVAALIAPQDASTPPRDLLGHKIISIAISRPQHTADGATIPTKPLLVSSGGGYVAFSSDESVLEQYLRSSDGNVKPLSQTPGLADAEARVGGAGGGLFGYQNQSDVMRTSFKLMKSAVASDLTTQMLPPVIREWLDFSLLPDYDAVAKYFYISVYSANTSDGMTLKVFTPRPPQLN
jgi:hypothetical protein